MKQKLPTKLAIRNIHIIVLYCVLLAILLTTFLFSFSSCSQEPKWEPYESREENPIELVYQAEDYTPTVSYLVNDSGYSDVSWSPEFFGFPLYREYVHRYISINPDLDLQLAKQKLSEKFMSSYQGMTHVDSSDKSISQKFIRQLNYAKIPELQQLPIENNLKVRSYLSLDTGHFVWFKMRLDGKSIDFLAELSPDGTILRVFSTNTELYYSSSICVKVN